MVPNLSVKEKIKSLLKPGETLSQRVVRGGLWVFGIRAVRESLRLLRTLFLARLLAPNDFGTLGIATLTLSALGHFTETGFNTALIQKKGDTKAFLNTAWTVNGLRGTIISLLLFTAAPYVASFFNEPAAVHVVQVVALSVLIGSWSNIGSMYFIKDLEFNKQFAYEIGGSVADLTVAISMALILKNVWALVLGLLAGAIAQFALSYILHPYRPRPQLDLAKIRELFGFGKWILASSILLFLINEGDDLFLGKVLGVTALGFYQMAYSISNLPATQITQVISQVTFPAYSKLQDNLPKLREAYLKVIKLTAFMSFPLAAGIAVLAPEFTRLFLTEKWMPMVPAMQLLAVLGLSRSVSATTGPLFQGVGRPDIASKLQLVRLVVMASLIYPFTHLWDMAGTSLAVVVGALSVDPVAIYLAARVTQSKMRDVAAILGLPLLNAAIVFAVTYVLKSYAFSSVGVPTFLFLAGFGAFIYFALAYIFDRWMGYNMVSLIKEQLRILKGTSQLEKTEKIG